ncbi:hypothetical protein UlMin_006756 [Ulmus minor]
MESPRKVKEVQSLTGRVAALNRFISRATDKCQPFFRALRKGKDFSWTADSALIREEEGVQWPIYYTSKSLLDAETRYPEVEKLALALMIAARKLRPYFQAHTIIFDILFKPRTAIKGQALADFIAEFTYQPTNLELAKELVPSPSSLWHLYVDGSSTDNCSGAGVILVSPEKVRLSCALRFRFKATNNQAEYEALLAGLRLAKEVSARHLLIYSDSQLIVNQVNSEYQAKGEKMASYLEKAKELLGQFDTVTITQIPRNENTNADALARLATGLEDSLLKTVPLEILDEPSIDKHQQVDAISDKPTWMDPIIAYLRDGTLPQDKFEARRLRYRSARYFLDKDKLRKRSFSSPSLTCLNEDQAKYVLQEVHEGVCGNHSSGRALAHKVLRQGCYWPTIQADSLAFVQKCDKCQRFSTIPHQPPEKLTPVSSPWPFAKWGIDLIGPLPTARGQLKFGIPRELVSDHGTQFENERLRSTCQNLGITKFFSSPAHPKILWSYRTSFRTTTGETPFSLAYGVDAVVPVKLGIPTFRIENFTEEDNDVLLALASDLLEEKHDKAQLRATALQQTVVRHYNSKVRLRRFTKGDLVLRRIFLNTKEKGVGVLGPNWEGPYRVRAILRTGTYELETLGGRVLANPWNAEHLKKYYQ